MQFRYLLIGGLSKGKFLILEILNLKCTKKIRLLWWVSCTIILMFKETRFKNLHFASSPMYYSMKCAPAPVLQLHFSKSFWDVLPAYWGRDIRDEIYSNTLQKCNSSPLDSKSLEWVSVCAADVVSTSCKSNEIKARWGCWLADYLGRFTAHSMIVLYC